MSDDIAISVRNLSKRYLLYSRPQDRLKQSLLWRMGRNYAREFWALRGINFEVRRGETMGIIGRNGSGKSTLLQIIAGTLQPTGGHVQANGRVAALLELGSGFNPEFTGRENVYLNGSILGLSRAHIDHIFDDIVAFADIGQFIDQPVKLYSSGMFVRLAFAVQAFVPKEIFIVDEALAVGDEAFQRKCMAALERFRQNGGTVLLVSHDTQLVVRQCERCLLLHYGQLLANDQSKPVTDLYQKLLYSTPQRSAEILTILKQRGLRDALLDLTAQDGERPQVPGRDPMTPDDDPPDWFDPDLPQTDEVIYGSGDAEIYDYGVYNQRGQRVNVLVVGRRYRFVYLVRFHRDVRDVQFGMMLKTVEGLEVAGIASRLERCTVEHIPSSAVVEASFSFKLNVVPGTYFLNAGVDGEADGTQTYLHRRVDICMIRVLPRDSRGWYGIAHLEPSFSYSFKSGQHASGTK
jgi:lipopolysaccharide transport system ATP-binding protein